MVPAASPKALRRSEECTRWLDRYAFEGARYRLAKTGGWISCTSIVSIDAVRNKRLQVGQPVSKITHFSLICILRTWIVPKNPSWTKLINKTSGQVEQA